MFTLSFPHLNLVSMIRTELSRHLNIVLNSSKFFPFLNYFSKHYWQWNFTNEFKYPIWGLKKMFVVLLQTFTSLLIVFVLSICTPETLNSSFTLFSFISCTFFFIFDFILLDRSSSKVLCTHRLLLWNQI